MAEPREESPEPITAYVRHRLEEWETEGRTLKELIVRGGFGGKGGKSSMPSQVKNGTSSVTNVTGPKFAQAFGFADYPELVSAAYAWMRAEDKSALSPQGGPLAEGIRIALGYSVTQAQVDRVVAAVGDRRDRLDGLEWLGLFLAERSLDARIDSELLAAARAAEARKPRLTDVEKKRIAAEKKMAEHRAVAEQAAAKRRHHENKAGNRAVRKQRKKKPDETG